MIISTEAITWFLLGKSLDDKTILKLAKNNNMVVSDSLRKNISNLFQKKHNQSKTTTLNIESFFKDFLNKTGLENEANHIDITSDIHLSTKKQNLIYIESGYSNFFRNSNSEASFVSVEINRIFKTLFDYVVQEEAGTSEECVTKLILENELFSQLSLESDIYIDLGTHEVIHGKFSLSILLYICACLDINEGENKSSTFHLIFKKLLLDIYKLKNPFHYFVLLFSDYHREKGKPLSFEKVSEIFDIEQKSFNRYMSGKRKLHIKHMDSVVENGGLLYFYILFWTTFFLKLSKNNELLFIDFFNNYPSYFETAHLNFTKFKSSEI